MKQAKNINLKQLLDHFKSAKKILIATHESPDGDGIGSIIALGAALKFLKKKVKLYMADPVPKIYRFMPGQDEITSTLTPSEKFDVSLILDLGEVERVGEVFRDHPHRGKTISIDHHTSGAHNGDYNYCLPRQASSGEVVYKILKALKVKLNKVMATAIYTAMVTDTGSFKYSNTTQETFAIASELLGYGVDVWQVALNCFETSSLGRMELLKRVLSRMQVHASKKIAWIVIRQSDYKKTGAATNETEGFINLPRSIEGVEVAVVIKENSRNKYKVSLRSKNYVDVAAIAAEFGGGGHIRASGFKINGPLEQVKKTVIERLVTDL